MSLVYPAALAALLAGIGVYGVLARRNAVLMLIGVELILNSANLLFVTAGSRSGVPFAAGPVLALFTITIAAAEVVVALAIVLVMFRRFGHIDLTAAPDLTDEPEREEPADPIASATAGDASPAGLSAGDEPASVPARPVAEEVS
ncbi:NADH-quinone oxidoreductase subunit NuoK [Intrasporangium calvum]|uniref:NADH-quinone oxidoreductase subunit K n=1 Tax=Intrasporangium calvum TaxID=53358 RepID=A0ABT5GHK9_9MICO|nr:NADH-quinone oxidoreductase subunit NuoK [Intrasporangium calvum]MDC5697730.1 NADH-quinone oxidoreductase subunit NuoK [Intrasporangium calvum]